MHSLDDADMMDNDIENNLNASLSTNNVPATINADNFSSYNVDFEVNNSSIDLDQYSQGFTGLMRINRLVFLAEHCPTIRLVALKLAISFVIETYNTQLYTSIHKQLTEALSKLFALDLIDFFVVVYLLLNLS